MQFNVRYSVGLCLKWMGLRHRQISENGVEKLVIVGKWSSTVSDFPETATPLYHAQCIPCHI